MKAITVISVLFLILVCGVAFWMWTPGPAQVVPAPLDAAPVDAMGSGASKPISIPASEPAPSTPPLSAKPDASLPFAHLWDGVTYSGLVRDHLKRPLADVEVIAIPEEVHWRLEKQLLYAIRTTSAADGTFNLDGVHPGNVRIEARAPGFCGREEVGQLKRTGGASLLVIELAACSSIHGRITTESGEPLADATVQFRGIGMHSRNDSQAWRNYSLEAISNKAGEYTLNSAPPGHLSIMATHARFRDEIMEVELVEGESRRLDFELSPGLAIRGIVMTETGRPLPGAKVTGRTLQGQGELRIRRTESLEDGTFTLDGLESVMFKLEARHDLGLDPDDNSRAYEASHTFAAGTEGVKLILLAVAGVVEGDVIDPEGKPARFASLNFRYPVSGLFTYADENGHFRAGGVPPGSSVFAHAPGFGVSETLALDPEPAEVITGLVLQLQSGQRIAGKLVGEPGLRVAGVPVHARGVEDAALRLATVSRDDGNFAITGLLGSTYTLSLTLDEGMPLDPAVLTDVAPGTEDLLIQLVHGASITGVVRGPDGQGTLAQIIASAGGPEKTCDTAADGAYRMTGLTAGRWRLTAESSDSLALTSVMVNLAADQELSGVDLQLKSSGTIEGKIIDESGAPVAGVMLSVTPVKPGTSPRQGWPALTSDPDGLFRTTGLEPSPHYVRIAPGRGFISLDGWSLQASPGDFVTLRVSRGVSLLGLVHDPEGQPVGDYRIRVDRLRPSGEREPVALEQIKRPDGKFRIGGVPADAEALIVESAGYPPLLTPLMHLPSQGEVDLGTLQLQRGQELTGVVTCDRGPVAGASVTARHDGLSIPRGLSTRAHLDPTLPRDTTDAAGAFTLDGLGAGPWELLVTADGYSPSQTQIEIGADGGRQIHVQLVASGAITGRLLGAGSAPISGQSILLVGADRSMVQARTSADGEFEFKNLSAGSYTVMTSWGRVDHPRDGSFMSAEQRQMKVDVVAGIVSRVEFKGYEPCRVHGCIAAFATLPAPLPGLITLTSNDATFGAALTDPDGCFEFPAIIPGAYTLLIHGLYSESLEVPNTAEFQHDIALGATVLAGRVTSAAGLAVGGVEVSVRTESSQLTLASTATGPGGEFRFADLPPGSYFVAAASSEGARSPVVRAALVYGSSTELQLELAMAMAAQLRVAVVSAEGLAVPAMTVFCATTAWQIPADALAITGADGVATITGLPADTYNIVVISSTRAGAMSKLTVAAAEELHTQMMLPSDQAQLELTITRAGQPAANCGVQIMDDQDRPLFFLDGATPIRQLTTDAAGILLTPPLAPGAVRIAVYPSPSGVTSQHHATVPWGVTMAVVRIELP